MLPLLSGARHSSRSSCLSSAWREGRVGGGEGRVIDGRERGKEGEGERED